MSQMKRDIRRIRRDMPQIKQAKNLVSRFF